MRKFLLLIPLLVAACADRGLTGDEAARDAVPPRLDVRAPLRGSIATGKSVIEVRGVASDSDSAIAHVTVNGTQVTLRPDGGFTTNVNVVPGLTLIHTVVQDTDGNETSDTRAVLGGNLVPVESTVKDGYVVNLDRTAIHVGGQLAAKGLDQLDLTEIMKSVNPLVEIPVPCLGARVDITKMKKGKVSIDLWPVAGGLQLDATIEDVDVGVRVAYDVGCNTGNADASAKAGKFHLNGTLGVRLGPDGKVVVDTSDTAAWFEGFGLASNFLPSEVTDFIETPVGDTLAAVIADMVQKKIPPVLGALITADQVVTIHGQYLRVGFSPTAVTFSADGAKIVTDSRLYLQGSPGAVFLSNPEARPNLDAMPTRSLRMGMADDAINQMLTSIWSAGIFDQTFNVDAGNYAGLGVLFDRVELALRLPPVITALPHDGGVRVTLGDVECAFIRARPGEPVKTVTRLSLAAETTVRVVVKDSKLSLSASEPTVWLSILSDGVTGHDPFNNSTIQELGTFVAKNLVGFTSDLVSNIPLPTLPGMTIVDADVSTGLSPGYVLVSGSVSLQ